MPEWKRPGVLVAAPPCHIATAAIGVIRALYLCVALALAHSTGALAQSSVPPTLVAGISHQPLQQALEDFAHQTGLQVAYVDEIMRDRKTQGAPPGLAPTDALARLLDGTGLRSEFLNARIVRIITADPQPHDAHHGDAPLPTSEEVVVTAHAIRVPKPPQFAPATAQEQHAFEIANEDLELRIARAQLLYGHPALDRYVQGVAERLLATDPRAVHVRVIKGARANAFALSNGSIYLTTALLAALNDESELAAVLGHELTHYTNAHMLRGLREEKHAAIVSIATGVLLGTALGVVAVHNNVTPNSIPVRGFEVPRPAMAFWARSSLSGYSRGLECEADDGGIRRMVVAGYDPSGALAALQRLVEQTSSERTDELPYYASRRKLAERIASYRGLIASDLASAVRTGGATRRAEYREQLAELPLDQVAVLLEAGALDRADAVLETEMAAGDSARAEFLKGEIARNRIPQTDATVERALAAYERAVTLPDAPVSAYRQAGLLHRLHGESAAAVVAFQNYLERAPTAVDAALVRIYLDELRTAAPISEAKQ